MLTDYWQAIFTLRQKLYSQKQNADPLQDRRFGTAVLAV
jgi:hypothetical protein